MAQRRSQRSARGRLLLHGTFRAPLAGGDTISCIAYGVWPARYENDMIDLDVKSRRLERSVQSMKKVMAVAENEGVFLNCEVVNRFEGYMLNTAQEGIAFCRQVDSPNVGLLMDTFHMNIEEDDLPQAMLAVGEAGFLGHVHVSEPSRAVPFHDTRVDWSGIGCALRDVDYQGSVTIESVLASLGATTYDMRLWRNLLEPYNMQRLDEALEQGLEYLRSHFLTNSFA